MQPQPPTTSSTSMPRTKASEEVLKFNYGLSDSASLPLNLLTVADPHNTLNRTTGTRARKQLHHGHGQNNHGTTTNGETPTIGGGSKYNKNNFMKQKRKPSNADLQLFLTSRYKFQRTRSTAQLGSSTVSPGIPALWRKSCTRVTSATPEPAAADD